MSEASPKEAEAWARIYRDDPGDLTAAERIFRRNADLALSCALRHARPAQRWVDLGAGTGWFARQLAGAGLQVLGIEIDREMLRWARRDDSTVRPGTASFVLADALRLPVASQSLDGVVAVSVLGALAKPRAVFHEVARVLRPGGVFIATASNHESRLAVVHAFMQRNGLAPTLAAGLRSGGYRGYGAAQLTRMAGASGLTVTSLTYHQPTLSVGPWTVPPPAALPVIERTVDGTPLARHLGRAMLLVARRG